MSYDQSVYFVVHVFNIYIEHICWGREVWGIFLVPQKKSVWDIRRKIQKIHFVFHFLSFGDIWRKGVMNLVTSGEREWYIWWHLEKGSDTFGDIWRKGVIHLVISGEREWYIWWHLEKGSDTFGDIWRKGVIHLVTSGEREWYICALYCGWVCISLSTKSVSSNPVHSEVYSIQHYVIKLVSDLWQIGGFLRFPPLIKLNATI